MTIGEGVEVSTWGTAFGGGNGLWKSLDIAMFGGNVGHAAVSVTFKADDQSKEWIKQYCLKPTIPYEKVKDDAGNEYYVVHFSWFPGAKGHMLSESLNSDNMNQRTAVHVNWDPKYRDLINPEKRFHRGHFGGKLMSYGQTNIMHQRNLGENDKALFLKLNEKLIKERENQSLKVLQSKLRTRIDKKDTSTLTRAEQLILERAYPDWKPKSGNISGKLNRNDLDELQNGIALKIESNDEYIAERECYLKARFARNSYDKFTAIRNLLQIKNHDLERTNNALRSNPNDEALQLKQATLKEEIRELQEQQRELRKSPTFKHEENLERLEMILEVIESSNSDSPIQDGLFIDLLQEANIPNGEIDEIKRVVEIAITKEKEAILENELAVPLMAQGEGRAYMTQGNKPDKTNYLALDSQMGENGLNAARMLQQMHAIAQQGRAFDLDTNNCSTTVGSILREGAPEKYKTFFDNNALGAIGNPQMVYNNCEKYQQNALNPKKSHFLLSNIRQFSPIQRGVGWCTKTLLLSTHPQDKPPSPLKKIAAGLAIVPLAIASALAAPVVMLINPAEKWRENRAFLSYIQSHESKLLATLGTVVTIPSLLLCAVPAGIQMGASNTIKKIRSAISGEQREESEPTIDKRIEFNTKLEENIVTIKSNVPAKALALYQASLENPSSIPMLDPKYKVQLIKNIKKIEKRNPELAETYRNQLASFELDSARRIHALSREVFQISDSPQAKVQEYHVQETKPAKTKVQEQYFVVTPFLGKPLSSTLDLNVIKSAPPVSMTPIDESLADAIANYFDTHPDLREIKKGNKIGELTISHDIFKDDSGNIYALNDKPLGSGSFGVAILAQAIHTPENSQAKKGEVYVVKILDITPEQTKMQIEKEMRFMEKAGQLIGGTLLEHEIIVKEALYKLVKNEDDSNLQDRPIVMHSPQQGTFVAKQEDEEALQSGTFVAKQEDEEALQSGTFVAKQEDEEALQSGTFVAKQDDEEALQSGTFVAKQEDEAALQSGTFVAKQEDEEAPQLGTFVAIQDGEELSPHGTFVSNSQPIAEPAEKPKSSGLAYDFSRINAPLEAVQTPKLTLQELIETKNAQQVIEIKLEDKSNIFAFPASQYLELFEKMAAEVARVHDLGILHRDIKDDNFLIDSDGNPHLIDWGCSKDTATDRLKPPVKCLEGSPSNIGPEFFHEDYQEPISTKQDIYGLGNLFSEFLKNDLIACSDKFFKREHPTPNVTSDYKAHLFVPMLQKCQFENPDNDPKITALNQLIQLINRMNSPDVSARPEAHEIKELLHNIRQQLNAKLDFTLEQRQAPQHALSTQSELSAPENSTLPSHNRNIFLRFQNKHEENTLLREAKSIQKAHPNDSFLKDLHEKLIELKARGKTVNLINACHELYNEKYKSSYEKPEAAQQESVVNFLIANIKPHCKPSVYQEIERGVLHLQSNQKLSNGSPKEARSNSKQPSMSLFQQQEIIKAASNDNASLEPQSPSAKPEKKRSYTSLFSLRNSSTQPSNDRASHNSNPDPDPEIVSSKTRLKK